MTVYAIRNKATDKIRLVDADSQAAALRHVAGDEYAITRPSPREISELGRRGVFAEDYGVASEAEPQAEAPLEQGQGE